MYVSPIYFLAYIPATSFPVAPTAGTRRDSQEVIRLASLPFLQLSQTPSPCASLGPVPITTGLADKYGVS